MAYKPKEFEANAFDLAILRALPPEGATIGKYIKDAKSVKVLRLEVDTVPTTEHYASALKWMARHGYVVCIKNHSHRAAGWQRTKKGDELIQPELRVAG